MTLAARSEEKLSAIAAEVDGRMAEVDDLVGAMVYLASEASDFTTGHDITIDGGPPPGEG